jgi:hypothetical protein
MTTQASAEQKHEMSEGGATTAATLRELSRAGIAQVDPSGQLADVLSLPDHLRDARRRMAAAS